MRTSTGSGLMLSVEHYLSQQVGGGEHLYAPGRSRVKSWWVARGRNPRKLLDFRDFVGLKTYLPRSNFYYISLIMNRVKLIK
jgi:hypothetical protein